MTLDATNIPVFGMPGVVIVRDTEFRPSRTHAVNYTAQPMIMVKNDGESDRDKAENEYYERGKRVSDFSVRVPSMEGHVNHVQDLCVCQHSRLTHTSVLGGRTEDESVAITDQCSAKRADGSQCRCQQLTIVSSKSKHAYQRSMKAQKRRVVDLWPGDLVVVGWTTWAGRVRMLDHKVGGMVAEVIEAKPSLADDDPKAQGQHWTQRGWIVKTELGTSFPQPGGDYVYVVKDR